MKTDFSSIESGMLLLHTCLSHSQKVTLYFDCQTAAKMDEYVRVLTALISTCQIFRLKKIAKTWLSKLETSNAAYDYISQLNMCPFEGYSRTWRRYNRWLLLWSHTTWRNITESRCVTTKYCHRSVNQCSDWRNVESSQVIKFCRASHTKCARLPPDPIAVNPTFVWETGSRTQYVGNFYCYLQVVAATLEGKPAQVAPPTLLSVSSASIVISWSVPGLPNGRLTNYTIVETIPESRVVKTFSPDDQQFSLTIYGEYSIYTFFFRSALIYVLWTSVKSMLRISERKQTTLSIDCWLSVSLLLHRVDAKIIVICLFSKYVHNFGNKMTAIWKQLTRCLHAHAKI